MARINKKFMSKLITISITILIVFIYTKFFRKESVIPVGKGHISVPAYSDKKNKNIKVWTYKSETWEEGDPIVFVMHGTKRNAKEYRDVWAKLVGQKHIFILAPEFKRSLTSKSSKSYNEGNMFDDKHLPNPKKHWAFTVVENVFDKVVELEDVSNNEYDIFGHSAGGQFVHRMVLFYPEAKIRKAIAANSGWYTFPDTTIEYPYGLKSGYIDNSIMEEAYKKDLIVMLGVRDTNDYHWGLRRTEEALLQGEDRLARGLKFYDFAKSTASKTRMEFNWEMDTVPDVGHQYSKMSEEAIRLIELD